MRYLINFSSSILYFSYRYLYTNAKRFDSAAAAASACYYLNAAYWALSAAAACYYLNASSAACYYIKASSAASNSSNSSKSA